MPVRTSDGGAGYDDTGGAPVVADWEVSVVWLKGIGWALERIIRSMYCKKKERGGSYSKHSPNVESMVFACKEVRVIPYLHR